MQIENNWLWIIFVDTAFLDVKYYKEVKNCRQILGNILLKCRLFKKKHVNNVKSCIKLNLKV